MNPEKKYSKFFVYNYSAQSLCEYYETSNMVPMMIFLSDGKVAFMTFVLHMSNANTKNTVKIFNDFPFFKFHIHSAHG